MKCPNGIIVELANKKLCYNGIPIEYDFVAKTSITATFKDGLAMPSDFNSPLFAPDSGVVIHSNDPNILEGDLVILDYFAIVRKLGKSIEQFQQAADGVYEVVDGKVRIPVSTVRTPEKYVYGLFRNGEFVQYNDWNIVQLIEEKTEGKIHLLTLDKKSEKYVERVDTKKCRVLYGDNQGSVCLYDEHYLLGEAQRSIIDGVEVRFIQSEYILAEIEI